MDGENEKGKREGGKGRTGDKLMRICACEQVSAEKEEGGGRRKANGKVCANKKVSTLSLFKAFFSIHPGFQPTKHEPLPPKQTQWKCGVLRKSLLTFSVILKSDLSQKATKPLCAQPTVKLATHALTAQRKKLCDKCTRSGSCVGMKEGTWWWCSWWVCG